MRASHSAAGFAAVLVMLGASSVQAEVLLGSAAPLTGQMAWHGEQHERGIQMAVSEINAAGGLLGKPWRPSLPMIIAIPSKRSLPPTS